MIEIESETREKVRSLLKELFQFDTQDLDFGIYRIMNLKRKEIEKFIDEGLIAAAETEFKEYAKSGISELLKEIEKLKSEIIRDFGQGTIDNQGEVRKNEDTPKVMEYIKKKEELKTAGITQEQINDVFNRIFDFFSRYYDKGDFVSKRRFGAREKYYVPYNGEEVLLHWANKDQYYTKSGEYFKNYSFRAGSWRISFLLKQPGIEPSDVGGKTRFFVLDESQSAKLDEKEKELDIHFNWTVLTEDKKKKYGPRANQETINSDIIGTLESEITDKNLLMELHRRADEKRTVLEKHVSRCFSANTTDYFVHKNVGKFLEQELDFYLKNEVLGLDEIEYMNEKNVHLVKAKVHAIRTIAGKIIEFLAQIEDYQKMLFEKKKFVLRTEYSITIDRVAEELWDEVLKNGAQIEEWSKFFSLEELSGIAGRKPDATFLRKHPTLMIDTQYFPEDFRWKLLASFDDLDNSLDGLLIKSESFQALNLLQNAWRGRINCVYIDPPFNTAASTILYKNNYKHSSWLSLMNDRVQKSFDLMKDDSIICVAIDDYELPALSYCLLAMFGEERHLATVAVRSNPHGRAMASGFSTNHEYALFFGKTDQAVIGRIPRSSKRKARYPASDEHGFFAWINFRGTGAHTRRTDRPKLFYPVYVSKTAEIRISPMKWSENAQKWEPLEGPKTDESIVLPIDDEKRERVWTLGWERAREEGTSTDLVAKLVDGNWQIYRKYRPHQEGAVPGTWWDDAKYSATESGTRILKDMFGERETFSYPKSVYLVEDCLRASNCSDNSWVLDYFAGSGTTAHAVLNLNQDGGNRKYILVESADYFDTVLLPRIKKAVFSLKWKDGKPMAQKGVSHMVKYQYLEQYEDTLRNLEFLGLEKGQVALERFGEEYLLRYMLRFETSGSASLLSLDQFRNPFSYRLEAEEAGQVESRTIDLVETFNYLLGLRVERLREFKDDDHVYRVVLGKRGEEKTVVIWRNTEDLDLEKDKSFIESILKDSMIDRIFINGDSYVRNAQSIEPEFKRLMGDKSA